MTRGPSVTTLPTLDAAEAAHVELVRARIRERVAAAGGWLAFDDYMDCVLYAPGLGYYSAGATKFGAAGDFVTAPELSDLFARALARQFADVLADTGGGVLEVGAGSGRFARVALDELAALDAQGGAAPYAILEVSADLRERQRTTLAQSPAALARTRWLDGPPAAHRGVVFANELLDALPCDRFVMQRGRPLRLGVALHAGMPTWAVRAPQPADAADAAWLADVERVLDVGGDAPRELPDGYCSEVCPRVAGWLAEIAAGLERGAVILIDYGLPRRHYYHPERVAGTLRCHFRQRAHDDPFSNPGLTDITAWVDFTRVAEAADAAGLEVAGFATQAAFLLSLGIESLVATTGDGLGDARHLAAVQGLKRLLLPGEMGEAVKVMVLTRGLDRPLRGLRLQDLRGSL